MTDAQREIINLLGDIKAAQGGGAVGVTSVSGTAPIASSGGATPAISIDPATPSDPGSMSAADKTKLDALPGYLVYTALLTQTLTDAPVATVLRNTLGGTVVWSYGSTGVYIATLSGVFTTDKTFIQVTNSIGGDPVILAGVQTDINSVTLLSFRSTDGVARDIGTGTGAISFEIRVYP